MKLNFMDGRTARKKYPQFGSGNSDLIVGADGWIWVSRQGIRTYPESLARSVIGPNEDHVLYSEDHRGNFVNAIRYGHKTVSNIEVAAHDEMIAQMSDIAVRLKRKLDWDPIKEEFIGDEQANRRLSKAMRSPWRLESADLVPKQA